MSENDKETKSKFNKQVLTRFIQTECDRQLFLDLARRKPDLWIFPTREIEKPKIHRHKSGILEEWGRKYEQSVYSHLISLDQSIKYKISNEIVSETRLTFEIFNEIYQELSNNNQIVLLEFIYSNPFSFFRNLFNSEENIPIEFSDQRPDILICEKVSNQYKEIFELLPNSTIRKVPDKELETRYGIRIIDIKNVRDINVGKKQFTEILYYMFTLTNFIQENNLLDKFFIQVEGNGIFPKLDENKLSDPKKVPEFLNLFIPLIWEESNPIFFQILKKIQSLWNRCPCSVESIPVNIQPNCGYCYYIEDCKKTLGMNESTPREEWSLKLIPYTSMSIAQQLIDRGYSTIGDVADNVGNIVVGNTPEPLYAELPLLELKARAIIEDRIIPPRPGHIHAYSLPKYTSISISFAVETDPANQRIYVAGLYLFMSVSSRSKFSLVHENWWRIWKQCVLNNDTPIEIKTKLDNMLIRPIPIETVERFLYLWKKLKKATIFLKGEKKKDGSEIKQTTIIYQFAQLNEGNDDQTEFEFARKIILKLNYVLNLSNIIENYLVYYGDKAGSYYGPSTSIFYWSERQLANFQDMLERNLSYIVDDPKAAPAFESIVSLFTPSDSEIAHPYLHKKLYNLQEFTETVIGFPSIISYTWHEIAREKYGARVNSQFWIDHFNYMDYHNWYEFILEEDKVKRDTKRENIRRQIMFKVRTINNLRMRFQSEYNIIISQYSRVINDSDFNSVILNSDYHSIAQVWYLFSKFSGAFEEMETEYYRTTYPEYSIGKLAAAKVEDLIIFESDEGKVHCRFSLIGLSSNMKISIGDRVFLIPDEERDILLNRQVEKYKVTISEMVWDSNLNGYNVGTEETGSSFFKDLKDDIKKKTWYLYPYSIDSWSKKLYGTNGLLQRCNFGESWLGARLAYLWNIRSNPILSWPYAWQFSSPSVYLFAPNLIQQIPIIRPTERLLTNINPIPDDSQKDAINLALNNYISGIQGPPGTGKSQTIAALVDEYYKRSIKSGKKSIKILISCFSYAALRVIVEKVRKSKDNSGKPTDSAKLQMIFLRSIYQKPIKHVDGLKDVDDLVRRGNTWKLNNQNRSVTASKLLEESLDDSFIIFANAHQLYYLNERVETDFSFDLIIIDEASQLPTNYFMSALQFTHKHIFKIQEPENAGKPGVLIDNPKFIENLVLDQDFKYSLLTKIVIVGDYNQLPPVQPVEPPSKLEIVLDSLFSYYVRNHNIPNAQLKVNYRSNKEIVKYTSLLGIYKDLKASPLNELRILSGDAANISKDWVRNVLKPEKVVGCLIHNQLYEIGVSALEADLVAEIVVGFYEMKNIKEKRQEVRFWDEEVGVVAPHNAQGRLIIRNLFDKLTDPKKPLTKLSNRHLMRLISNAVYSVEKFQGSDREFIISSIGLSDKDQLNAESEFIYNLNRFNVLTSRAKSKLVLIASSKYLQFIPMERNVIKESANIRKFAYEFCNLEEQIIIVKENNEKEKILFRYRNIEK